MKKTISININGIFFHIDDNAYNTLEQYLESLRKHFSSSEGKDEILEDIEARIAELFQRKMDDTKHVIQLEDVEEVITMLGRPADISDNGSEDKEPAGEPTTRKSRRRLYRDTDNRVLGGVCSGLGHYFDVDPIWFRLAFLIMLLFGGASILIYIAMWIIIPPAVSTAERLEMKGEYINIHTIEKNIRDEINDLKKRYRNMRDRNRPGTEQEVRDFKRRMRHLKRELRSRRRIPVVENGGVGSRIGGVIENLVFYTVKAILILLGILFLILGTVLTAALILSITGSENFFMVSHWGMTTFSLPAFAALIFESPAQSYIALTGLLLLLGVPLVMMIFNGMKLVLGYRKRTRIVSMLASGLWLVGLLLSIYTSVMVYRSFQQKSADKIVLNIKPPADSTLTITVPATGLQISNEEEFPNRIVLNNLYFISDEASTKGYGVPSLRFVPSDSTNYSVTVTRMSHGNTMLQARQKARAIDYEVQQADSVLKLDNLFDLPVHEKWRNQHVRIAVRVPVGQKLCFDKSMENLLITDNAMDETWNEDMIGKTMIMTPTGLTESH